MIYIFFLPYNILIQCKEDDTFGEIFNNFAVKINVNKSELTFIYNGNIIENNSTSTFKEKANPIDKDRKYMNIVVDLLDKSENEGMSLSHRDHIATRNINRRNISSHNRNKDKRFTRHDFFDIIILFLSFIFFIINLFLNINLKDKINGITFDKTNIQKLYDDVGIDINKINIILNNLNNSAGNEELERKFESFKEDINANLKAFEEIPILKEEININTNKLKELLILKEIINNNTKKLDEMVLMKEEINKNKKKTDEIKLFKEEIKEMTKKIYDIGLYKEEINNNTKKLNEIPLIKEQINNNTKKLSEIQAIKEQINNNANKLSEFKTIKEQINNNTKKLSEIQTIKDQINNNTEQLSEIPMLKKQINNNTNKLSEIQIIKEQINNNTNMLADMPIISEQIRNHSKKLDELPILRKELKNNTKKFEEIKSFKEEIKIITKKLYEVQQVKEDIEEHKNKLELVIEKLEYREYKLQEIDIIKKQINFMNNTINKINNINTASIESVMKNYADKYIFPNMTNILVKNAVNSQKLQNKDIGVTPGSIVNIQDNGKIYSNIIFTKGMIIAWFGTINDVPENWVICNGTNGTPDLRNKFIIGTSDEIKFSATGGRSQISLSKSNLPPIGKSYFSCDSHNGKYHQANNGFIKFQNLYSVGVKSGNPDNWGNDLLIDLNEGMNSSPIDIMNPYYSLFYIMKL